MMNGHDEDSSTELQLEEAVGLGHNGHIEDVKGHDSQMDRE